MKRADIMAQARHEWEARRTRPLAAARRAEREVTRQLASPLQRATRFGSPNRETQERGDARYAQRREHANEVYVQRAGFLGVDHFRAYVGGFLAHAAHRFAAAQADGDARECLRIVAEVRQWGEHAITRVVATGSFTGLKHFRAPHEIALEVWSAQCARYGFAIAANTGGGDRASDVARPTDAGPFAKPERAVGERAVSKFERESTRYAARRRDGDVSGYNRVASARLREGR
jgi:hypothetical protein